MTAASGDGPAAAASVQPPAEVSPLQSTAPEQEPTATSDSDTDEQDRMAVLAAVRAMIAFEQSRVDDPITGVPGGHPTDIHGRHGIDQDGEPDKRPGRPLCNPEGWRWFRLIDVGWLDGAVWITFAWDEPGTPDLQYLATQSVRRYAALGPEVAAMAVRSLLRDLLDPLDPVASMPSNATPGWRNRTPRTWLTPRLVLVGATSYEQDALDEAWNIPGSITS